MIRPEEEILIRFFRGQCSTEEELPISLYLSMDVDKEYVQSCLQKAFPDLKDEHDPTISNLEMDRVWSRMDIPVTHRLTGTYGWIRKRAAYAAVWIFAILCATAYFIAAKKTTATVPVEIAWKHLSARPGAIKIITLPDESKVTLFPGSSLEISNLFNKDNRMVKLDGRAFFEVVSDPEKPFLVADGHLLTRVLGTSFEVKAEPERSVVTLHSGQVSVMGGKTELARLSRNQRLVYDNHAGSFTVDSVSTSRLPLWVSGEWAYDQEPLSTVFHDVERWYGITITSETPGLMNMKITTSFRNMPLERIMDMLTKSAGLTYIKSDHQFLIKRKE